MFDSSLSEIGFKDVEFYHGGILGQGKDLTMWRDDSGQRKDYAVVVKKGDLTGLQRGPTTPAKAQPKYASATAPHSKTNALSRIGRFTSAS